MDTTIINRSCAQINCFFFTIENQNCLIALEEKSQIGLLGVKLWFPATLQGGVLRRSINTSAEGGRFWKHPIVIEIREIHKTEECYWVSLDDISNFECSLDLNLAICLL